MGALPRSSEDRIAAVQPEAQPDDATLVARALDADRWAEEALYRKHVRRVSDVAARILGRTGEAEDVVQETFLRAFSNLERLRDADRFEAWLMRIAMNQVRARLRKRKLLRTFGLDRTVDDATLERFAAPLVPADVCLELRGIDRALGTLPANHRMAWTLRMVEGFTLPEAAGACGCSLATIKRWIASAQAVVDRHLELVEEPER